MWRITVLLRRVHCAWLIRRSCPGCFDPVHHGRVTSARCYLLSIMLDQNASNEVMMRRHQSRLPPVYEARNLFNTLRAGTSNPPVVNRVEAPRTGTPDQPGTMGPPQQNRELPQYVPAPLGHFTTPLDNMIAAASRLVAIPMESDSPVAVETRRARDLL